MKDHAKAKRYVAVTKAAIYALIVAFVSAIVMTVVSVQYSNYVDRVSNQRWCGIMTVMDNAYGAQPPSSATGKEIAREIKKLRQEFSC